jgi:hypothetical protein
MIGGAASTQYGITESAERFEVSLIRYPLSYSASSPWLVRYFTHLLESAILPGWMSHYALSIGNENIRYYFDLRRKGTLPFASVACFNEVNSAEENEQDKTLRRKSHLEPLRLGTTDLHPKDIMQTSMSHHFGYWTYKLTRPSQRTRPDLQREICQCDKLPDQGPPRILPPPGQLSALHPRADPTH